MPFDVQYAAETIPVFARWFGSWQISVQRLAFRSPELSHLYDRAICQRLSVACVGRKRRLAGVPDGAPHTSEA